MNEIRGESLSRHPAVKTFRAQRSYAAQPSRTDHGLPNSLHACRAETLGTDYGDR